MSIRNTAIRATGGFEPSGAFSIEIKSKNSLIGIGKSLGEHFFYPGLTRLEHAYTFNISTKVTFGGSSVVDYGNGLSYITLSSEIHPQYTGKPVRNPDIDLSSGGLNAAKSIASNLIFEAIDTINPFRKPGYIEMIDLLWLFVRSRRSQSGFKEYPFSLLGAVYPNAGDIKTQAEIQNIKYLNLDNITMVFHDYDRDEHWEVAPDPQSGFNVSQSNDRTQMYVFTMKLVGLRQLSNKKKLVRPPVPNVRSMLNNALIDIGSLLNALSSDLFRFADIVSAFQDLKKYKELLLNDIRSFNQTNKSIINKVKSKSKKTGQLTKELLDLILKVEKTNIPDLDDIDSSIPSEDFTNNAITNGSLELTGSATNETVNELNNLQTQLSIVDTAMILSENSINVNSLSSFYTVQPGDSLPGLANEFLGNPSAIDQIINMNNGNPLTPGDIIQIPSNSTLNSLNNSGVLTAIPDLNSISNLPQYLENALLGSDITPDLINNNNLDIGMVSGIDSLVDTINDILSNEFGVVPLQPDFSPIEIVGQPNELILSLSLPRQIIEAVNQEIGVYDTEIKNLYFEKDTLKIKLSIIPITSNQPIEIDLDKTAKRIIT